MFSLVCLLSQVCGGFVDLLPKPVDLAKLCVLFFFSCWKVLRDKNLPEQ